jgi:hypothetical protein
MYGGFFLFGGDAIVCPTGINKNMQPCESIIIFFQSNIDIEIIKSSIGTIATFIALQEAVEYLNMNRLE